MGKGEAISQEEANRGYFTDLEVINRKLGNTLRLPEGHFRLFHPGNPKEGNWMKMLESALANSLVEGLKNLAGEMPF